MYFGEGWAKIGHFPQAQAVTLFEYPLNERIRTLMRLEDLFARFAHFAAEDHPLAHHAALLALFELLEVARGDLKSDLIQELERQKHALEPLRKSPEVKLDTLEDVLRDIGNTVNALQGMPGKLGQHLRENEWVMSIKQRAGIPGGTCEFDLPSYHYWLSLSAALRKSHLDEWMSPFEPLRQAIAIILTLLRDSGEPLKRVAHHGSYQQMLSGRPAQMLRVGLDERWPCFPEISANKYALHIRFTELSVPERPRAFDADIDFDLTLCCL